jgi:hypothetical protein
MENPSMAGLAFSATQGGAGSQELRASGGASAAVPTSSATGADKAPQGTASVR